MTVRRRKRRGRFGFLRGVLLIVGGLVLLASLLGLYYDAKMRPAVRVMGISQAQDIATRIINESVADLMPSYGTLCEVITSEDGRVRSVRVDSSALNRLKADVALTVLDRLGHIENDSVIRLPVGSLLGMEILSAVGPKIDVRILPVTSVFTDVSSELTAVGVNQTRHRVILTVSVTATLIFPTEMTDMEYKSDIVVSDTVILGDVPEVYAAFENDGDRLKDKIIIP